MSLSLLQSYSSDEEEDYGDDIQDEISSDDENVGSVFSSALFYKPLLDPKPTSSSSLPSAFDAFSEIAGPPQFLNNIVQEEVVKVDVQQWRHGRRRNRNDKKDLPSGAVVKSKPQLVGIHDRVRSDVQGKVSQGQSTLPPKKSVATAGNPNAEDAAELLRMCVRCGIPKTYSHAKGMVCPVCGDRPAPLEADNEALKKKGSAIKDKEKNKRMKGQSSHATWKSETEMQLRQQFD